MRQFLFERSLDVIAEAKTERDILIVCALRRGHSYQQVADAFHVSKTHVHRVAHKYKGLVNATIETNIDRSE
jgi:transposase